MHNRKPYKIIDRKREIKKGVMAESLEELISRGKIFLFFFLEKKLASLQKRNESLFGIFQYYTFYVQLRQFYNPSKTIIGTCPLSIVFRF